LVGVARSPSCSSRRGAFQASHGSNHRKRPAASIHFTGMPNTFGGGILASLYSFCGKWSGAVFCTNDIAVLVVLFTSFAMVSGSNTRYCEDQFSYEKSDHSQRLVSLG
jgi:hypothetical protein